MITDSTTPAAALIQWSDFLQTLWRDRILAIVIVLVATAVGVVYALVTPTWYRADVVMVPADQKSIPGALGQLGGLASLAGVTLSSGSETEPLAVLRSQGFSRDFIRDKGIVDDILQGFGRSGPDKDIRDALKVFDKKVRVITESKKEGTITLSIIWRDPSEAAEWANEMVATLNQRQRNRALDEAQRNVTFLEQEITRTTTVSLQQSIGRVLESEMQKLLLARGNEEFSYKVIDPAVPPKDRFSPRRAVIVVLSFLFGIFLAFGMIVIRLFRVTALTESKK